MREEEQNYEDVRAYPAQPDVRVKLLSKTAVRVR